VTRPGGLTVAFGPPDTTDPAEPGPDSGLPNGV
jgi:hypothetical protein